MSVQNSFLYSNSPEPHRIRTKEILKTNPEIRKLIGKNPATFLAIVGIVALQLILCWQLGTQSWWLVVGIAYLIGAFADHALFVLIHECSHRLVFKNPSANRLAGILANIPQLIPSSVSFERYHIKHHSFQGVMELDGDLPNEWEAKLINNRFFGKLFWLLFYPFFQLFRLSRLREIKPFDGWIALNMLVQFIFIVLVSYFLGPKAIIYL